MLESQSQPLAGLARHPGFRLPGRRCLTSARRGLVRGGVWLQCTLRVLLWRSGFQVTACNPQCELKDKEAFIVGTSKFTQILYGGRVRVSYHTSYNSIKFNELSLVIDGIEIRKLYSNASFYTSSTPSEVVAYLNQIENLGVDSFLENYKRQLQQAKHEFEAFADGLQQELAINYDEKKAEELSKYRKFILTLGCILFALLINMNAGLQNTDYINAYENIITSYF